MNASDESAVRDRLSELLAQLDTEDVLGSESQQTVELDQQAVGRLSRMDALQNQEMAKAQAGRRYAQRQRIAAAFTRLDEGEYGYCTDCGDLLDAARLATDPTLPRCLSCIRG